MCRLIDSLTNDATRWTGTPYGIYGDSMLWESPCYPNELSFNIASPGPYGFAEAYVGTSDYDIHLSTIFPLTKLCIAYWRMKKIKYGKKQAQIEEQLFTSLKNARGE